MERYIDLNSVVHYAGDAAHELAELCERARSSDTPLSSSGVQGIVGSVVTALDAPGQRAALVGSLEFSPRGAAQRARGSAVA